MSQKVNGIQKKEPRLSRSTRKENEVQFKWLGITMIYR